MLTGQSICLAIRQTGETLNPAYLSDEALECKKKHGKGSRAGRAGMYRPDGKIREANGLSPLSLSETWAAKDGRALPRLRGTWVLFDIVLTTGIPSWVWREQPVRYVFFSFCSRSATGSCRLFRMAQARTRYVSYWDSGTRRYIEYYFLLLLGGPGLVTNKALCARLTILVDWTTILCR